MGSTISALKYIRYFEMWYFHIYDLYFHFKNTCSFHSKFQRTQQKECDWNTYSFHNLLWRKWQNEILINGIAFVIYWGVQKCWQKLDVKNVSLNYLISLRTFWMLLLFMSHGIEQNTTLKFHLTWSFAFCNMWILLAKMSFSNSQYWWVETENVDVNISLNFISIKQLGNRYYIIISSVNFQSY